jgi:cardiolipin synthase
VYLKKDVFVHSKLVVIDSEILSIGSGNFDNRSFDHNFETNILIYDSKLATKVYKSVVNDCESSSKLQLDQFIKRPLQDKFFEGIARFFSPLL